MLFPFAFAGRMRPLPYAASSLSCFFSQHLLAALVLAAQGVPVAAAASHWRFFMMPLRSLARDGVASDWVLIAALAYLLIAAPLRVGIPAGGRRRDQRLGRGLCHGSGHSGCHHRRPLRAADA